MADKLYRPKKEEIQTQKTGTYFVAENKNGNGKKKSYSEYTKDELVVEIEKLKKRKKYGLVWEEQEEKFDKDALGKLPVLKEIKNREIKTDKKAPVNLLIEGDNYHSLSVLNYTHDKAIDVIYIDPPYNTGNRDFIYNDSYVDREDSYRHSKWLSFIHKRLRLAKNVLKNAGAIFISIDDNELYQLKLLMDDIFDEKNFIATFIWNKKNVVQNDAKFVSTNHEYVICYAKNLERLTKFNLLPRTEMLNARYSNPDNDPRGPWTSVALQAKSGTEANRYKIKFPNGVKWEPVPGTYPRLSKDSLMKAYEESRLWFGKNGKNVPRLKKYLNEVKQGVVSNSILLPDEVGSTQAAKEAIKRILGINVFETPKPAALIKRFIQLTTDNNGIILDFFAGSGTTGQAVLELNKENGGHRQFILCTNNEDNNGSNLGVATDICYPRVKKVIEGYKDANNKKVIAGLGGNLKYFKTAFVDSTPNDANKQKLTDQSTEMLCVRENTFEPVFEKAKLKIFRNDKKHTAIIFDQLLIPEFKKLAEKIESPIHTYIFTLEDEDFSGEFDGLDGRIIVSPIPEAILRVYRRIFSIKL